MVIFIELVQYAKNIGGKSQKNLVEHQIINKKRYDSELPYQRPDLIEVMEIEIDLTTSTNVHTSFYISVRECLD